MTDDVIGAVLAGGRGRRIGRDKPSLEIAGRSLARRAADALRGAGLDVALVLRARQPVPLIGQTRAVLRDEVEDAGPLGGLEPLLRWLPVEWTLVAPCDQPLLMAALLQELLAQPRDDVDAVVGQPAVALQPLPGLYRRTCLPAVQRALDRGDRSLCDLLASLRVRCVPERALRRADPELRSYVNVNTAADLARARALAATLEKSHQPQQLLYHRR